MHRSLLVLSTSLLAAGATAAAAAPAGAATQAKLPVVRSATPKSLTIGQTLVLRGTALREGKARSTVVFRRAGGKAIFARATKATSTSLSVVVPSALQAQLPVVGGVATPVRFQLRVLTRRFSKGFTALKVSPLIGPARGSGGGTGATGPAVASPAPAAAGPTGPATTESQPAPSPGTDVAPPPTGTPSGDPTPTPTPCVPSDPKADSDSDLLDNATEARLKTDPCQPDSDGDGMTDGWEQLSALDRDEGATPSSQPRPYPNALDPGDGASDQDGDGLTNTQEFAAWAAGGRTLAAADADPYTSRLGYSGGNPTSAGRVTTAAQADYLSYADHDHNGFLSDLERDADGDGLPNVDEGVGFSIVADDGTAGANSDVGMFSPTYVTAVEGRRDGATRCGGINQVPYYCGTIVPAKVDPLDWLDPDSDDDGIKDGADDADHDDVANLPEYRAELQRPLEVREYAQVNACFPDVGSRFCLLGDGDIDGDGIANGVDQDADGDGLSNTTEAQLGTRELLADSDGDGVRDGFEQRSALDLNSTALPFPGKRPYPNPLDATDGSTDFDGDGLALVEEQAAWIASGSPQSLTYSDGTQYTGGMIRAGTVPGTDLDGNGYLSDDEKDVDDDGIGNWSELHGPGQPGWWEEAFADETPYVGRVFGGLDFTDADTDGDGLIDGLDDEDHDGFTNATEMRRPSDWQMTYVSVGHAGSNPRARVNPFNPCKPFFSSKCHTHPPFGAYREDEDWASPVHADGP